MNKMKKCMSLLILVSILINGLNVQVYAIPEDETFTLLVYLCGSDLESDEGFASQDLNEMLRGQMDDNINLLVYTGGTKEWKTDAYNLPDIKENQNQLWKVEEDEMVHVKDYANLNVGHSTTLTGFIMDAVQMYPADHYGIVLWNHGGGPMVGFGADENNWYDSLTVAELERGFSDAYKATGVNFDFIGFDACLMGSVEIAESLAPFGDYMISSEETEPGHGWDYKAIIDKLNELSVYDSEELSRTIIDSYYEHAKENDSQYLITLSLLDLSKIDPLMEAFDALFEQMNYDIARDINTEAILEARIMAESYGESYVGDFSFDMVDLYDFTRRLEGVYEEATVLMDKIDNMVLYNLNSIYKPRAYGLSVYIPNESMTDISDAINVLNGLDFSRAFTSFISQYLAKMNQYQTFVNETRMSEDTYEYGTEESFNDVHEVFTSSDSVSVGFRDVTLGEGNEIYVNFEETFDHDGHLGVYVGQVDEEYIYYMGSSTISRYSEKDEFYKYSSSLVDQWFALDGYMLYLTTMMSAYSGEYTTMISPAFINDELYYLYIDFDISREEPLLLGYHHDWYIYDNEELYQLEVGDKIETLCQYDEKTQFGYVSRGYGIRDEFVLEDTELQVIDLPEGSYAYAFNSSDSQGSSAEQTNWLVVDSEQVVETEDVLYRDFILEWLGNEGYFSDGFYRNLLKFELHNDIAVYPEAPNVPITSLSDGASDWAKYYIDLAGGRDLLVESIAQRYTENITRSEYCELIVNMLEKYMTIDMDSSYDPFTDTKELFIKKAAYLGIVDGYGNGKFGPNDLITREQLVVMTFRAMLLINPGYINWNNDCDFDDMDQVSDWAVKEIGYLFSMYIIDGIGNNLFDPQGNATIEQTIKVMTDVDDRINVRLSQD